MKPHRPTTFRHSLDSQKAFAALSGDFNPLHLDPVRARRTLFGQIAVHGVHNVLLGLEAHLTGEAVRIDRVAVTFKTPVFLNRDVSAESDDGGQVVLRCRDGDAAMIRLQSHEDDALPSSHTLSPPGFPETPEEWSLDQLQHREGMVDLAGDADAIRRAFPHCTRALGLDGVARLLGLTRLVGMQCPGLHSLFSGFDVSFASERTTEPTRYRVVRADGRISLLTLSVEGGGMRGTVNAFMRPPPVPQPDMATVTKAISGAPYKHVDALVIGGSRGLGEISAKIIAAGGGRVTITYLNGKEDAERVAGDISRAGGRCRALKLDVGDCAQAIGELEGTPTHLLYFATPPISHGRAEQFREVYVTGLEALVQALRERGRGPLTLFYPSSVYVDEGPPDLADYAAAKAEGEETARRLADDEAGLNVVIERLPPLATDQTASLLDVARENPLELMAFLLDKALISA